MQYRMEAGLRKYITDTLIINFSTYRANVIVKNAQLVYEEDIKGMWDMDPIGKVILPMSIYR